MAPDSLRTGGAASGFPTPRPSPAQYHRVATWRHVQLPTNAVGDVQTQRRGRAPTWPMTFPATTRSTPPRPPQSTARTVEEHYAYMKQVAKDIAAQARAAGDDGALAAAREKLKKMVASPGRLA